MASAPNSFGPSVKYDIANPVIAPLRPGELGYSYESGTLFIGPPNLDQGGENVIEILKFQNNVLNFIIQEVRIDVIDRIPSSNAVFNALRTKADLNHSNFFRASNYFPDVDIATTPPSQEQLVVNVRSLKGYLGATLQRFTDDILNNAHMAYTQRYEFLISSDTWVIRHIYDTDSVNVTIRELGTNKLLAAPYSTIDNATIEIYFSYPVAGYADIEFF